jgi:hypothetical protein
MRRVKRSGPGFCFFIDRYDFEGKILFHGKYRIDSDYWKFVLNCTIKMTYLLVTVSALRQVNKIQWRRPFSLNKKLCLNYSTGILQTEFLIHLVGLRT